MSRTRLFTATVLTACLVAGSASSQIWPFGRRERPAAEPAAANETPAAQTAEAPAAPRRPASAADRAAAGRLDPLAQAAFWGREVEVNPADAEAGVNMARALRGLGQYAQAAQAAERVIVLQPNNGDALLEVARAKIGQNQGFYAIEPLTRARQLDPRDWRIPNMLGVAYHQTERRAEAQAAWTQALTLSPENPEVLSNQAMALAADGDLTQAETLLRRAAARPGATLLVRQNLVLVLGLRGNVAEAEQLARRDLPPEAVNNNLAWLRANGSAAATGRNWEALRGGPAPVAAPAG